MLSARHDVPQRILHRHEVIARCQLIKLDFAVHLRHEIVLENLNSVSELGHVRHSHLSRRCRRLSAPVSHEIGNREVNLVPHRRNHRNLAPINRPCDDFLVESLQVLGRAAASADDQSIYIIKILAYHIEHSRNVRGGSCALHEHWENHDIHEIRPALDNLQNVLKRGASLGCHDSNLLREFRDRLFLLWCEQALSIQLLLEYLKRRCKLARAAILNAPDEKRVCAAFFIDVDIAVYDDLHPVFELDFGCLHVARWEKAIYFARFVFD